MSVSCSGVCVGRTIVTIGPNGITEKARNAGIAAIIGARTKTTLSAAFGTMSSFSASLMPSARRLQQAERAVHVRPDPVLHPGDDPALAPDGEQGQQHQEHEDQHRLEDHEPRRVVAEGGERASGTHAAPPVIVTRQPAGPTRCRTDPPGHSPAPRPCRRRGRPRRPSSSNEPSGPVTVTMAPGTTPISARVAGPASSTGRRAVAAGGRRRPACGRRRGAASRRPADNPAGVGRPGTQRGQRVAVTVPGVELGSSAWTWATVRKPSSTPISSAMPASTRRSGSDALPAAPGRRPAPGPPSSRTRRTCR